MYGSTTSQISTHTLLACSAGLRASWRTLAQCNAYREGWDVAGGRRVGWNWLDDGVVVGIEPDRFTATALPMLEDVRSSGVEMFLPAVQRKTSMVFSLEAPRDAWSIHVT